MTAALADLREWVALQPPAPGRDTYLAFLEERGATAMRRDGGPEHVTGSCFVFTPGLDRVLLCFHRKGRFWVQFGGHVEAGDATVADAALREAREESGIAGLQLLTRQIVDLDRHELHGGFSCAAHWDVGHVALTPEDTPLAVSDESEDLAWFPVDRLPDDAPAGLAARITAALALARANAG